jgi:hypothetical protein
MVVAIVALVAALDGPAIARETAHAARVIISGKNIKKGTITGKQVKDHSLTRKDLASGVFGNFFTKTQSDARYVNKVQGTVNEAPNAAALGGKDASQFLDKASSDARYVNIVPGTVNEAPNAAQLGGHAPSDFPLVGTDVTGSLTVAAVPAHSCTTLETDVTGARLGDLPVIAFVGGTPAIPGLIFEAIKINSPDHMTLRVCNPTASASTATSDVGVRVIAFR